MRKFLIKIGLVLLSAISLAYGFKEGMEWYRLFCVFLGGVLLGKAIQI